MRTIESRASEAVSWMSRVVKSNLPRLPAHRHTCRHTEPVMVCYLISASLSLLVSHDPQPPAPLRPLSSLPRRSIKNAPGGPVIEWPRGVGWGEQGGGPGVGRRRRTGLYDHDLDPMVVDDLATMQHNGREL